MIYLKCGVRYFKTAELFSSIIVGRFSIFASSSNIRIGNIDCGIFSFIVVVTGRMTEARLVLSINRPIKFILSSTFVETTFDCEALNKAYI